MDEVRVKHQDDQLTVEISGRIDSGNAGDVEEELGRLTQDYEGPELIVDVKDLDYISSAGLRILLRLLKKHKKLRIVNASTEIYEILEMTGFTEMMEVEKAYRELSVEGCEVIGSGANGKVYRYNDELVVKVYKDANALEDIQSERELARLALVLGIPTAISYDVVRVGDTYGSVFELLDAHSFSKILAEQPEKMDWCVKEYVKLLKLIHSTKVPKGKLPSMKQIALDWAKFVREYLPEEEGNKLVRLVEDVPEDDHMIHGDYHTKNLELTGDEVLLIDMDTLAVGHPVFEFASMYNAFVGFGEYDNNVTREFMGFERERAGEFWHRSLKAYLETEDEERIREVEDKARIIGYTRLIRRSIRRKGLEDPERTAEIELWKQRLVELLHRVDSLTFSGSQIHLKATKENLHQLTDFVEKELDKIGCTMKEEMQIQVAAEEIFINIANYAYAPETGDATVRIETEEDPKAVVLTFIDQGVPYDPVKREDPDVTLPAGEREIGGLGIFMVKKSMDEMIYDYRNGSNVLVLKKHLSNE